MTSSRPYMVTYTEPITGCIAIQITPDQLIYKLLTERLKILKDHHIEIYCECVDRLSEFDTFTIIATYKNKDELIEKVLNKFEDIKAFYNPSASVFYKKGELSKQSNWWLELTDEEARTIYHCYSKYKRPIK